MIKNNCKVMLLLSATMLIFVPLHAIQNSTAQLCTALVAGMCVAGSYKIECEVPQQINPAWFGGLSCLITATTYLLLQRATPSGRIKRANALLDDLARHTLVRTCFDNELPFFDAVQDVYLTDDLPLISAYNHLIALVPVVHHALYLINKASAEVGKDVLLQEECDASLSRANMLFKNISDAIKRIREHKDYLPQLTIYKDSFVHQQQTIAQQQMAQTQQSSLRLKWFKFLARI